MSGELSERGLNGRKVSVCMTQKRRGRNASDTRPRLIDGDDKCVELDVGEPGQGIRDGRQVGRHRDTTVVCGQVLRRNEHCALAESQNLTDVNSLSDLDLDQCCGQKRTMRGDFKPLLAEKWAFGTTATGSRPLSRGTKVPTRRDRPANR